LRILLNSPFILPIIGVRVRDIATSILEKLWKLRVENKVELYYTDLNILEVSWKISRLEFNNTIVERD